MYLLEDTLKKGTKDIKILLSQIITLEEVNVFLSDN